jgi:hypothetical protein
LAQAMCTVCEKSVMRPKTDFHRYRYPGAHSCIKCEELCCSACSCQCSCLAMCGLEWNEDLGRDYVEECTSCRGWCHCNCNESNETILFCNFCQGAFCEHCWVSFLRFCPQCGEVSCDDCLDMSWCDGCNEYYCDECRDIAFCQKCSSSFCSTCRVVGYCETCEVSYCDSCGHC